MSILLTGLIFCALYKVGGSLKVYNEDSTMEELNPEYFDLDGTNSAIIDNLIYTNFTIIKELPEEAELHFKLSGLSMGKYTLPTGLDFTMPLCDVASEPIMMEPFFSGLGILEKGCPPKPGYYHREGFYVPLDNLPDDFPNNKYKLLLHSYFEDETLFLVETYMDLQT